MKLIHKHKAVTGILAIILTGCTVGPDFQAPPSPIIDRYTESPLPTETAATPVRDGEAQRIDFTKQLSSQWWTMFGSPELNALIEQSLTQNPSLTAAEAAVDEASENLRAATGSLLTPQVDADLSSTKEKISAASYGGPPRTFSLLNASVSVTYTLDIFGASRRQIEALSAQVDYEKFQYEAAYLTLTANLATTAIQEASLRAQIAATNDVIAAEEQQLDLVQKQFELGAVSKASVLTQQSELAKTRATLPALTKQLSINRHALAALTGRLPGEGGLPSFQLDSLHLPDTLPVSLPSSIARQRPDVRASEALFHQAAAEVGVATANLYPQITLNSGYGVQSSSTGDLFTSQNTIWSLGAGLLQPVFHGGELAAKRRAAVASYNQAAAHYRQTILQAFQNVADVLRALDTDAEAVRAQAQAVAAAEATLELTRTQFQLGAVSYTSLLIAQQDYQLGLIGLVAARAQRYADTAALFQALGGGWWNRGQAEEKTVTNTEVP